MSNRAIDKKWNTGTVVVAHKINNSPIDCDDIDRILDKCLREAEAGTLSDSAAKKAISLANAKMKHVALLHVLSTAVGMKSHPKSLKFAKIELEGQISDES